MRTRTAAHSARRTSPAALATAALLATLAGAGVLVQAQTSAPAQTSQPTPSAATAPAEPSELANARANFLLEQRSMLAGMRTESPQAKPRRADEIVRFTIEDGSLVARIIADDLGDAASIPIEGTNAVATLNYIGTVDGAVGRTFNLIYHRVDDQDPARPRATYLQLMQGLGGLRFSIYDQSPLVSSSAELTDDPQPIIDPDGAPTAKLHFDREDEAQLAATENIDGPIGARNRLELEARHFAELLDRHHDEILDTAGEGFMSLRAMHVLSGLTELQARQLLLGGGRPDPAVSTGVNEVIDTLRKEGSAAVEASIAKLAQLGPRAATLLGQADRKGWSPDLRMSVDTVLAQITALPAQKSQTLLDTPTRLIDLLYWPDLAIRRAAAKRLEDTLGSERLARFKHEKDPYAQATLIESFRAAIPKAKR